MPKDSCRCAGTQELGLQLLPVSSLLLRATTSETQAPKSDSGRHFLQVEKGFARLRRFVRLSLQRLTDEFIQLLVFCIFFARGKVDSAPGGAAGGVS